MVEAERALEGAREQRANGQVTLAQAQARLQVATDRLHRLEAEHDTAAQRLQSLESELSTLADSDRSLAEQMASWQLDLAARVATLTDADERLTESEQHVRDADAALTAADQALDAARRESHEHESALHHAELRFTELSGRRAAIRERLETEWRRPLEDLMASFEALDVEDELLRAEAEQLRNELEKLGPVNPLAIEEHEEEVKRLDFITGQRNDLSEAKNKLQLAIREIDATARELFMATFVQVRENFRQIFMTLFGGGECDLRLENPELPLDCDIEVHASPRGKRTQRIHLLSSGERALVALSLLFGIFLTKPSPFCLLDEVDAPLDDANIGRYVRMLNQFKGKTQFIVITHNPRTTTEAADAVYGVTMQEPGVSSLVSVRMGGNTVDESPGRWRRERRVGKLGERSRRRTRLTTSRRAPAPDAPRRVGGTPVPRPPSPRPCCFRRLAPAPPPHHPLACRARRWWRTTRCGSWSIAGAGRSIAWRSWGSTGAPSRTSRSPTSTPTTPTTSPTCSTPGATGCSRRARRRSRSSGRWGRARFSTRLALTFGASLRLGGPHDRTRAGAG